MPVKQIGANPKINRASNLTPRADFKIFDLGRNCKELKEYMENYFTKTNADSPMGIAEDLVDSNGKTTGVYYVPGYYPTRVFFTTHIGVAFQQKMEFLQKYTYIDSRSKDLFSTKAIPFCRPPPTNQLLLGTEKNLVYNSFFADFLHITSNACEFSLEFQRFLKFAFHLSKVFYFHVRWEDSNSFERGGYNTLQSLFVTTMLNTRQTIDEGKMEKFWDIELNIVVHDVDFHVPTESIEPRILKKIDEAWANATCYLENHINVSGMSFYNLFRKLEIHTQIVYGEHGFGGDETSYNNKLKRVRKIMEDTNKNDDGYPAMSKEDITGKIQLAWQKARSIDFIPTGKNIFPIKYWTKTLIAYCSIESSFETLTLGLISLIKRWYAITDKKLYISNFKISLLKVMRKIQINENNLLQKMVDYQKNSKEGNYGTYNTTEIQTRIHAYTKRVTSLVEHHAKRIWVLQMKKLQYNCSEFYEKKILKLLTNNSSDFEKGKKDILSETEKIFYRTARDNDLEWLGKFVSVAILELKQVLEQYTDKCKETPVAELVDINRISKEIRSKGVKQRSFNAGMGITASVRLRGQGNFHIMTSYGLGPHVLNFTCINDRDTIENEFKEKVSPLRIQPSVNFDIKI